MVKSYYLSEKKRIVVKDNKAEIQIYRMGVTFSGAVCGTSWYTELVLTQNEFEELKKVLTNT